mmetsp:Transcript_64292/g.177943  ORF Transcript_64292/g.177943 Transcript_64292/m.177943 type:complete len:225 (-) Transcript_64292:94-768(-)
MYGTRVAPRLRRGPRSEGRRARVGVCRQCGTRTEWFVEGREWVYLCAPWSFGGSQDRSSRSCYKSYTSSDAPTPVVSSHAAMMRADLAVDPSARRCIVCGRVARYRCECGAPLCGHRGGGECFWRHAGLGRTSPVGVTGSDELHVLALPEYRAMGLTGRPKGKDGSVPCSVCGARTPPYRCTHPGCKDIVLCGDRSRGVCFARHVEMATGRVGTGSCGARSTSV